PIPPEKETLDPAAAWSGATLKSDTRIYGYTWADPHHDTWIAWRRTANHDEFPIGSGYEVEEAARAAVEAYYHLETAPHPLGVEAPGSIAVESLTSDEVRQVREMLADYFEHTVDLERAKVVVDAPAVASETAAAD